MAKTEINQHHHRPANMDNLCRRTVPKLDCLIYSSVLQSVNIIGVIINAFISSVNIIDLIKGRTLKPVDKVLVSLGLCRFTYQVLLTMDTTKYFVWYTNVPISRHSSLWLAIQKSLDFCNLWLTAWLCFVYCVKIVNSNLHIFQYLKLKIASLILPSVLGAVCISVISGSLFAWSFHEKFTNSPSNVSLQFEISYPPLVFGHFLPFLLAAFSSLLLLKTLLRHVCRFKKNIGDLPCPKMDIHMASIRTVLLFFVISALKLTSVIAKSAAPLDSVFFTFSFLLSHTFPTFHSFVILLGNSKLKCALHKVIAAIKPCNMIQPTTRRNIVTVTQ